jgi:hypothetical protein
VALENEGSNPSTHPSINAPIVQRTEHRSSDLTSNIPNCHFTFKVVNGMVNHRDNSEAQS